MAVSSVLFKSSNFLISYEILNEKNEKTIIFLHGWGADKTMMSLAFSKYLTDFKHVYIDLCGFGKSSCEFTLNSNDYKEIIALFLAQKNIKIDVIVGHSFGGKIASLLEPKFLILLSSAGIVEKKPLNIRLKIAVFKAFKPFLSGAFKKFFISKDAKNLNNTMYETFKNVVNEDFFDVFRKLSSKTLIFWGKNDKATSLKAGKEIQALIKNSQIIVLDGDHFFFLKHAEKIAKIMQKFLN